MDDNTKQSADPTRLIGRVTVVALALAGAAFVLLPSTLFGWSELKGGWAIQPVLFIANFTTLIGIVLALAIAWSRNAHRAAPLLGAALAASAIAWGLDSADAVRGLEGRVGALVAGGQAAAWLLGAACLSAFCTRFPRELTRTDIAAMKRRTVEGRVGSGLTAREDPYTVMDAPLHAWDRWVERRFGSGYQQRLQAFARRVGLLRSPGEGALWKQLVDEKAVHWLFLDAWRIVLAFVPLVVVSALFGWHGATSMVVALAGTLGLTSCMAQRFMLLDASADERRQTLWIAAGMVGAFVVVQLSFWVFIVCGFFDAFQLGTGVFILSAPVAALLVVLGFAIATFGSGALDPDLTIKRTLITGIVATLLTFMFAVLEGFVATLLAEQAGLPSALAPAIASAAIAVALGPMWRGVSGWVSAKFSIALPGGHVGA